MAEEESSDPEKTHAERVQRKRSNRSLKVLPSGTQEQWPANLGELLDWHTNEVEEVMRAAQLRLRDSAKIIEEYRRSTIGFDEAAERVMAHSMKWGEIFPGGIDGNTRGKSDEEIHSAIEKAKLDKEARAREGRS
jgi:hypothetical protein